MSIHDASTEVYKAVDLPAKVTGKVTCNIVNFLLKHTYVKLFIRIGDTPHKIAALVAQPFGKVKFLCTDGTVVNSDWFCRMEFYMAGDTEELEKGWKDGKSINLPGVQ